MPGNLIPFPCREQEVLIVELCDDALEAHGYSCGDRALVNLKREPVDGDLAAVRSDSHVFIGYVFYVALGLFLYGATLNTRPRFFHTSAGKPIGVVQRVRKRDGREIPVTERHFATGHLNRLIK